MSYKNLSTINTVTKTASYDILDTEEYLWYLVDASAGDVTIKMPLLANNYNKPVGIKFVKTASTNKAIIIPHATDATKLTNDNLASIYLPKVGDYILFIGCQTSGFWEVLDEKVTNNLRLDGFAGYGSSDTKIMRFTSLTYSNGNYFSENHSTGYNSNTEGIEITINRTGYYSCLLCSNPQGSAEDWNGFSLNSSQLTTGIRSITQANKLVVAYVNVSTDNSPHVIKRFEKGDVIRVHTNDNRTCSASTFMTLEFIG